MLLLGLALTAVVRSRLDGWALRTAQRVVAEKLGGKLEAERLHVVPRRLELRFAGVELRLPDGVAIRVGEGRLRVSALGLVGLAAGRAQLEELELDRPEIRWPARGGARRRAAGRNREGLPLDLRVGRLTVRDGRFDYEDRSVPWNLDAKSVEIDAAWNPLASSLTGRSRFRLELERPPMV